MPRRRLTRSEILTPAPLAPAAVAAQGLDIAPNPGMAERAAEAIVLGVDSGALQPGQRMVEVELAMLLQMSRVP